MLEQIRAIEEQAAQIRQNAQIKGKEKLAAVQNEIREQRQKDAEAERLATREGIQAAEEEGRIIAQKIIEEREQEAIASCLKADKKAEEAVSYLVGRVVSSE
jgi:hypothetical protein